MPLLMAKLNTTRRHRRLDTMNNIALDHPGKLNRILSQSVECELIAVAGDFKMYIQCSTQVVLAAPFAIVSCDCILQDFVPCA